MSTKYEVGGHLIDANGGKHRIVDTDPPFQKVSIQAAISAHGYVWVDPSHYRYEPPKKPEPTRFEVGQVWEREGESDREVVLVGKNGVGLFFWMDRLTGKALGDTADIEFCLANGWKLKEGA